MKMVVMVLGVAMLLMGTLWFCQGMGWVQWPASSFMIDMRPWAWRGALLAGLGALLLWWGRRRAV